MTQWSRTAQPGPASADDSVDVAPQAPGKQTRSEGLPSFAPAAASEAAPGGAAAGAAPVQARPSAEPWVMNSGMISALGLGASAVQRRASADGAASADASGNDGGQAPQVSAIAQRGVESASSALPHLDAIASSFGRYDVSGIRAQVGGEATAASRAIGAEAYATGDRVGFASSPDLHTAAHEAAHVVQQRAGVSLKGGLGRAGDLYEQHADSVADAVVAGRSAEALLAPFAGGEGFASSERTGTGTGAAVQRRGGGGFNLFDPDAEVEQEELFVRSGSGVQIDPDCTFASELPTLTARLDEMLGEAPTLAEKLATSLDGDDDFADLIEAALTGKDLGKGAGEKFWAEVRSAGVAGTALAYFAERNGILGKFEDPKVPILGVVGEKGAERYELSANHWLIRGGFTRLPALLNTTLKDRGPEIVEALQQLDEAKDNDHGGSEIARILDDLIGATASRTPVLKQAHEGWKQLSEMARFELMRLFDTLGFAAELAPGGRLDQIINGIPVVEEPAYKARPATKVFDEAQSGHWANKDELERLSEVIGRRSAAGFVDHEVEKHRTGHLRATIDQMERTYPRLSQVDGDKEKLDARSLIIDSNIASLLLADPEALAQEKTPDAKARLETRQRIVARIEREKFTSIRLANMNVLELYQDGSDLLTDPENPQRRRELPPIFGVPLTVKRSSPQYSQALIRLESDRIGQNKGAADRSMMADLFFAKVDQSGGTYSFMTIDKACVKPLMRWAQFDPVKGANAKNWQEMIAGATDGAHQDGSFPVAFPDSAISSGSVRVIPMDFGSEPLDAVADVDADAENGSGAVDQQAQGGQQDAAQGSGSPQSAPVDGHKLIDAKAGEKHTVRDYMRFISGLGYEVFIVGGAIRDQVQDKDANDIDLATSMPDQELLEALRKDPDVGKEFTSHTPEIHLIQIGKGGNQLDIACSKAADKDDGKKMDLRADARSRDFTMNTLYLTEGEKLEDPTGQGDADARAKKVTFAVPLEEIADDLRNNHPNHLARLIKFAIRGYTIDEDALAVVRPIAAEIITALDPRAKELFLNTFTAPTPRDIVVAMKKLGFPPEAMDALLPDQVRGAYDDSQGPKVYSRDLDVDRLDEIEEQGAEAWEGLAQPDEKKDARNSRVYQRRLRALAQGSDEKLVIDIDFTDHGIAGHRAPHHHIYRLTGEKWNKNAAGLSHTGQPGEPSIADGVYTGPRPWTWVPEHLAGDAEELRAQLDAQYPGKVELDGEIMTLGGQIRLHVSKVRELHESKQLTELMLMAQNVQSPVTRPHDKDDAWLKLTRSSKKILAGERLRFATHLQLVPPFLARCKLDAAVKFDEQPLEAQLRLYDLVGNFGQLPDEELERAAQAVITKGYGSPEELVERFELFLSTGHADEAELGAGKLTAQSAVLDEGSLTERRKALKARSGELGFRSTTAAAYHHAKHGDESKSASPDDYLQAARAVIAAEGNEGRSVLEQAGTENHTFFVGYRKAVVRVLADGSAHIATFFSERLEEAEEPAESPEQAPEAQAKPEEGAPARRLSEGLTELLAQEQTTGTRNQFQVEGARRACSAIAVLAIEQLVEQGGVPSEQAIDELLQRGGEVYRTLQGRQSAEVQLMRGLASGLGAGGPAINRLLDQLARETYYNPHDIGDQAPGVAHQRSETVHGGDVEGAVAQAIQILDGVARGGVAMVVGAYTVAITRRDADWYYFDSHGDALQGRAFTVHFTDEQRALLGERAVEGLRGRIAKGEGEQHDIGLSLFTPAEHN